MEKILKRPKPRGRHRLWEHDAALCKVVPSLVGIDEAGRGAFAGPVVAGAVWVNQHFFEGAELKRATKPIFDSKALDPVERDALLTLLEELQERGLLRYAPGLATVDEVEAHNVLGATRLAMQRALEALKLSLAPKTAIPLFDDTTSPHPHVLVDGRPLRTFPYAHEGLVQGDAKSLVIAMASIVAKVTRDRHMRDLAEKYPLYGFDAHKGYGTKSHQKAIIAHGVTPEHRASFLIKMLNKHEPTASHAQNELTFTRR